MNRSLTIDWTDATGACSVSLIPPSSIALNEIPIPDLAASSSVEERLARFARADDGEPAPEPDTSEMVPRPGDFGESITSEAEAKQRERTSSPLLSISQEKHLGRFKVRW